MVVPEVFTAISEKVGMIPPPGSTRKMKFPYTVTQQFGLFPWRFHYEKLWCFRYGIFGFAVVFPIFSWIGRKTRSPENYARVAEEKRRDHEKEHELHEARFQ